MRAACLAVLRELGEAGALHRDALTVNGKSIWENVNEAPCWNRDVIHPFAAPFKANAGIAVLRGNLAPDGAVIKPSAASPHLLQHRGRAVVFESIEEFHARINDEALDIDESCVMVLKNCGPRGYPGHGGSWQYADSAETAAQRHDRHGPHLRRAYERHRLRHRRPSRFARGCGGRDLALVRPGDIITLDVARRTVQLEVDDATLAPRRAQWKPPASPNAAGNASTWSMCSRHISVPIWIFWLATVAHAWRATPTERLGNCT